MDEELAGGQDGVIAIRICSFVICNPAKYVGCEKHPSNGFSVSELHKLHVKKNELKPEKCQCDKGFVVGGHLESLVFGADHWQLKFKQAQYFRFSYQQVITLPLHIGHFTPHLQSAKQGRLSNPP